MANTDVKVQFRARRVPVKGGPKRLEANVRARAGDLAYHYAQRVQGTAQSLAPVRTGRLKRSITRTRLGPYKHRVVVGAYYGIYVNYGTRHMAPQPFWEPALRAAKVAYIAEARRIFKP